MEYILARAAVVAVQETHLNYDLQLPDFHVNSSHDMEDEPKRGVALALNKSHFEAPEVVSRLKGSEIWVRTRVKSTGEEWLIGNLHLHGPSELHQVTTFLNKRQPVARPTIVLGDFNTPLTEGELNTLKKANFLTGAEGLKGNMSRFLSKSDLILCRANVLYTHAYKTKGLPDAECAKGRKGKRKSSSSWIDYILVSSSLRRRTKGMRWENAVGGSDHLPLFSEVNFGRPLPKETHWSRIGANDVADKAAGITTSLQALATVAQQDISFNKWSRLTAKSFAKELGRPLWEERQPMRRRHGWWFSKDIQRIWRSTRQAQWNYRIAIARGHHANMVTLLYDTWQKEKGILREKISETKKIRWTSAMLQMEENRVRNPARFAQLVKRMSGRATGEATKEIKDPNSGKLLTGKAADERILKELMVAVTLSKTIWTPARIEATKAETAAVRALAAPDSKMARQFEGGFKEEDLIIASKGGRSGSSPGLSGLTIPMIRLAIGVPEWRKRTIELINKSVVESNPPKAWSKVRLVAIPKGAASSSPGDWRGISLLEILYKVVAKMIEKKISAGRSWSRAAQFGFEAGKSTTLPLITLVEVWERRKRCGPGCETWFAALDIKKAFDSVSPWLLEFAMAAAEIPVRIVEFVLKMYFPTKVIGFLPSKDEKPKWQEASCGVRQGCTLAPAIFNLVRDLVIRELDSLPKTRIPWSMLGLNQLWYADDCILVAESGEHLAHLVDTTGGWMERHGLALNVRKCKILSSSTVNRPITWKGETLERVTELEYLGLPLPCTGELRPAANSRLVAAKKAYYSLSRSVLSNRLLTTQTKIAAARPLVEGSLYYGCECWGGEAAVVEEMDRMISGCCRKIFGLHRDGGSWAGVILEAGLFVPSMEVLRRRWRLFWRLCMDPTLQDTIISRLVREAANPANVWVRRNLMGSGSWVMGSLVGVWKFFTGDLRFIGQKDFEELFCTNYNRRLASALVVIGPNFKKTGQPLSSNASYQTEYMRLLDQGWQSKVLGAIPLSVGRNAWSALRTNALVWTARWWRILGNKTSMHVCCFCTGGDEDVAHLLWTCKAWKRPRKQLLSDLQRIVGAEIWRALALETRTQIALGGTCPLKEADRVDAANATIVYLNRIIPVRNILVRRWLRKNSPRKARKAGTSTPYSGSKE